MKLNIGIDVFKLDIAKIILLNGYLKGRGHETKKKNVAGLSGGILGENLH
jgi:hypothetical protein